MSQVYTKSDSDGEYAGFSISGHLLRNESVLNRADPEYDQLPLMLTQPLAVVQVHMAPPGRAAMVFIVWLRFLGATSCS